MFTDEDMKAAIAADKARSKEILNNIINGNVCFEKAIKALNTDLNELVENYIFQHLEKEDVIYADEDSMYNFIYDKHLSENEELVYISEFKGLEAALYLLCEKAGYEMIID